MPFDTLGTAAGTLQRGRALNVRHPWLTRPFSLAYNELNAGHPSERPHLRGFTRIRSDLYPDLHRHYEHVFDDWVAEADAEGDHLDTLDED